MALVVVMVMVMIEIVFLVNVQCWGYIIVGGWLWSNMKDNWKESWLEEELARGRVG
jgi:hypothetical protein